MTDIYLHFSCAHYGYVCQVSGLKIDIVEAYDIEQRCYTMPMREYLANFHTMVARSVMDQPCMTEIYLHLVCAHYG